MALFGRKKETTTDTTATNSAVDTVSATNVSSERAAADVLLRPHITEKAFALSQQRVYTFLISSRANAYQVRTAINQVYGVTPVKVNIVRRQPRTKRSLMRNRVSKQPGYKKAYVYLKAGDTINLM